MQQDARDGIFNAAWDLAQAFGSGDNLLDFFRHDALCLEHGSPDLRLPFATGATMRATEYFPLISELLEVQEARFERDDVVVDDRAFTACVVGKGRFVWKETGKGWNETFMWRLKLKPEDGRWMVWWYEVWSDTGAAVRAKEGKDSQ